MSHRLRQCLEAGDLRAFTLKDKRKSRTARQIAVPYDS